MSDTTGTPAPGLDPREEAYCLARARGETIVAAAREAGICEKTAHTWNKRPEIAARIDDLLAPITAEVMRHFRAHAMRAAERVTGFIEAGNAGAAGDLNFRASLAVLKFVGAEPPTRQELTVDDARLSDDERAARLAAILDAARARRDGQAAGDQ